jgi:hypothetical protein
MNLPHAYQPLREVIAQTRVQYATLTPQGIRLPGSADPNPTLRATIVMFKPARTRYVNRQPLCRSLNGISSVNRRRRCLGCEDKRGCTSQIALDILYHLVPYKLLIAYTSANNFLDFARKFDSPRTYIEGAVADITVIDRGRWGEACFALAEDAKT